MHGVPPLRAGHRVCRARQSRAPVPGPPYFSRSMATLLIFHKIVFHPLPRPAAVHRRFTSAVDPLRAYSWLAMYRAGGWDALKAKRIPGRPRKLEAVVLWSVARAAWPHVSEAAVAGLSAGWIAGRAVAEARVSADPGAGEARESADSLRGRQNPAASARRWLRFRSQ